MLAVLSADAGDLSSLARADEVARNPGVDNREKITRRRQPSAPPPAEQACRRRPRRDSRSGERGHAEGPQLPLTGQKKGWADAGTRQTHPRAATQPREEGGSCRATYLVTWPRISPSGNLAEWTLKYNLPA